MRYYVALVRKDAHSDFGVEFPDFPGCISAGTTLREAAEGAAEALALHVRGMVEDGETIPGPSELDDVRDASAVPILVPMAEPTGKVMRVNVTFNADVLAIIDTDAAARAMTRSAYLAAIAREQRGAAQSRQRRAQIGDLNRARKKRVAAIKNEKPIAGRAKGSARKKTSSTKTRSA
jgi:predicted RNase H-like HicB family nuclease